MKILIIFIFCSISLHSQVIRKDLYTKSEEALQKKDFKMTALYLFAFKEINIDYLKANKPFELLSINKTIEFSLKKIANIGLTNFGAKPTSSSTSLILDAKTKDDLLQGIDLNGLHYIIKSVELEKLEKRE